MRIVITGSNGGLGRQILNDWQNKPWELVPLVRRLPAQNSSSEKLRYVKVDYQNERQLVAALTGADILIHCAGKVSPTGRYKDFYEANVSLTELLLKASVQAKLKRFVYVSTPSVYVENFDHLNISEAGPLPLKPINHYASTKKMGEDLVLQYHLQGLTGIAIRPQGLIGPFDQTFLPRLMSLAKKGILPIIGSGRTMTDLTIASNVVDALELVSFAPNEVCGKVYNISNGEPVVFYDFLRRILRKLNLPVREIRIPLQLAFAMANVLETAFSFSEKEPPLTKYTVCAMGRSRTLDISRARNLLGYNPRIGLAEGVEVLLKQLSC